MGGQPPTKPIQNPNQDYQPVALNPERPWDIPSSHPEYKTQGLASGISSIAQALPTAFMGIKAGMSPNAKGGYDSKMAAQQAAPYRGGISFEPDMGYIPQAQGVNYQPDQFTQKYGYNIRGTEA
jgi:hypothetical protein